MGISEADLSTSSGQENFKLETQLKLQMLAREISGMKLVLEHPSTLSAVSHPSPPTVKPTPAQTATVRSAPQQSGSAADTTVMNVRVHSLADRLSELEKRPDYGFLVEGQTELERRVRNITESLNLVLQWQREFAQGQTHIRLSTPPPDLVIPQLSLTQIQPTKVDDAQLTDKSGSKGSGLNELWAMVGELNLKIKSLTTKEEMNSFIDSVHSRLKLEEAKLKLQPGALEAKPSEGDTRRLAELEQRLISASSSLSDLQDDLKQSKQLSTLQLQALKSALEARLDELKSSLTSLDRKWLSKLDDYSSACERRSQMCPYEDDFTMIRSLILKIRTDMQVIREIQDAQQTHPEEQIPIPTVNLDQISDSPELTAVKSVLQQHEQAIKYISSKVTSLATTASTDEVYANRQELTQALHRLDELKQEMVEIMAKQEASKALSQKDYELLNEIYGVLDSKISKEDLMQKVDKEELNKMFKVLKRKTDGLYENLRKAEQFPPPTTREDAYFLRKRLDKDCAACGQTLPENAEVQLPGYLSWSKFPARSPNIGPGFSRILNSLVLSPDGSMRLPERHSPRTDGVEDISSTLSGNLTSKPSKKSIRLDLQSESTVRHKVNVSTRLPAVKTSSTKT